ncbi:superoxide dismutase family protein [Spirilliplanes yamanashiensis]|uniref:Superoxide dismutase copper/zinc binding domain-containing protein n=1 Tax=Spirilliplanes yamanashiensis TaxID=42233 RepID=A0A8J3Y7B8_9ACTN|nr:superoxide dismutase family protein [Spirilliplanes yamanashiensis]MDP9817131.1 Cu-Zn family superoxide dismutase [Spirilliplanes yamanashiensis]GIJ03216.1 hypothetical protein Sya03_25680 [Spirilliplanes yamanashiensis]
MRRRPALTALLLVPALAAGATACGTGGDETGALPVPRPGGSAPIVPGGVLGAGIDEGTFAPWAVNETAVTYDPAVVPVGATASLSIAPETNGATVTLLVTGMLAKRGYGAHLHTAPCGPDGAAAGPHYQHTADPAATADPSVDSAYANPANEVWLDFTADDRGAATVTASGAWKLDGPDRPRSLVIHADRTATADGAAGTAGPRAACLTLSA